MATNPTRPHMHDDTAGAREALPDGSETGTPDSTYALISTAYHLLQGAETMEMFIEDASDAGNEDVAGFLEDTRLMFIERAEEATRLLVTCLAEELDDADDDDDDDDEDDEEGDQEDEEEK